MSINREWHEKHRMPKNPSEAERVRWYIGHEKNCNCRSMPLGIKAEIEKRKRNKPLAK